MNNALKIGDITLGGRVLLAPMTGVSDLPFRRACIAAGATYVATEMVASAELARGRPDVVRRAAVGEGLPLTVIQLVGRDPEVMGQGAAMAAKAGADIIDLNFGCPAKEVTGVQCGSALMRDLDLSERIIASAVAASDRPITVKMRLGWDLAAINAPELAQRAERLGVAGLTVHGRTRSQFYTGTADWRAVKAVVDAVSIPVIVNGDIVDSASAREALAASGAAGVMIGRGAYGRPWLAAQIDAALAGAGAGTADPEGRDRLEFVLTHAEAALRFYGHTLGNRMFRKHLGWYIDASRHCDPGQDRRAARARICRLEDLDAIRRELEQLWL